MTKHLIRSLKTSVFTAILYSGLSLGASGPVLASGVMKPVTGWSISKVGAENTPGYYCTLARRYDRNAIITVGENVDRDTSIAVEFEEVVFNKDETYAVTIETSDGLRRNFQINPATTKAFIARISNDDQFYNSFWNSRGLLISINGQSYSFKTDDIIDGKGQMQLCLGGKADQQAVQAAPPPAITTTRVTSTEVVRDSATDIAQMEALKQENAQLSDALNREREAYEGKAAQISAAQSAEVAEATRKLSALEGDNLRLQQEIAALKAPAEELKTLKQTLNTELAQLRSENEQLKVSLNETNSETVKSQDQLSALTQEKQMLTERLEALRVANEQRDQELNNAKKSEVAQLDVLSQSLETLTAENTKLKADLSKQQMSDAKKKDTQAEMLAATEAALQAVRDEKKQLEVKLQDITVQNRAEETDIAKKSEEHANAQAQLAMVRQELENLRRENAEMTDQLANARTNEQNTQNQDKAQTEKMREKVSQLSDQLQQISSEKTNLEEQLATLLQEQETSAGGNLSGTALETRYQEAELEIQRMGALLEQQRQQFEREKGELENMLFDPAVAEREQISYLAQLEKNLDVANKALEEQRRMYEERIIAASKGAPLSEVMPIETTRVASVTEPRPARASDPGMLREMSEEIQRLRGEVKRLSYKDEPVHDGSGMDEQDIADREAFIEDEMVAEFVPEEGLAKETNNKGKGIIQAVAPSASAEELVSAPEKDIEAIAIPEEDKVAELAAPDVLGDTAKAMEDDMEIVFIPDGSAAPVAEDKAAELAALADAEINTQKTDVVVDEVKTADATAKNPAAKTDVKETAKLTETDAPGGAAFSVAQTLSSVLDSPMPFANAVMMLQKTDPTMRITDTSKGMLQWISDGINGASIQNSLAQRPFEKTVNKLVETLQAECRGKLEMEPVVLRKSPTMNLYVYDAVCTGAQGDKTAASLIFYSKDGQDLMTISHEGAVQTQGEIVKKRDNLLDMLLAG